MVAASTIGTPQWAQRSAAARVPAWGPEPPPALSMAAEQLGQQYTRPPWVTRVLESTIGLWQWAQRSGLDAMGAPRAGRAGAPRLRDAPHRACQLARLERVRDGAQQLQRRERLGEIQVGPGQDRLGHPGP